MVRLSAAFCESKDQPDIIAVEKFRACQEDGSADNHTRDGVRKIQSSAISAFLEATVRYVNTWQS